MFLADFSTTQGKVLTQGLVMVGDATYNEFISESFVMENGVPSTEVNNNNHLRYRVFYWESQEDYDAGLTAYILDSPKTTETDVRSIEDKLWHEATDLDSTYADLTVEKKAEKHLKEVIFA